MTLVTTQPEMLAAASKSHGICTAADEISALTAALFDSHTAMYQAGPPPAPMRRP